MDLKRLKREYKYQGDVSLNGDTYNQKDLLVNTFDKDYNFWMPKYALILGCISKTTLYKNTTKEMYVIKGSQSTIPTFKSNHGILTLDKEQLKRYKKSIKHTLKSL